MTSPTAQPAPPLRTWRPMAAWTAGILLALGLAWFVAAVVVPFGRAYSMVKAYDEDRLCYSETVRSSDDLLRLLLYLRAPHWMAPRRPAAVSLLANHGEDALPSLEALLADGEPEVRAAAAKFLGLVGTGGNIPRLEQVLADQNAQVRIAAADALERIRFGVAVESVAGRAFISGFQYWATSAPLLTRDWLLVIGGTVEKSCKDSGLEGLRQCLVRIDKVFLADLSRPEVKAWSAGKDYLNCGSADDLKVGEKVIVFVSEYDGGTGILPAPQSNCSIGIKVTDWNEAIVPAVEAVCRDKLRKKALQDAQVQKAWRKFDDIGVDAVLQGKITLSSWSS